MVEAIRIHHTGGEIPQSDSQPGGSEIIFVGVQAILWTGGRGK